MTVYRTAPVYRPETATELCGLLAVAVMRKNRGLCPCATYADCVAYLDGRYWRKLCDNTVLIGGYADDSIVISYYSTAILRFYPSGVVRYNNGGYDRPTTRERINFYAPETIHRGRFDETHAPFNRETFRYAYGDTVLYFSALLGGSYRFRLRQGKTILRDGITRAEDETAHALFLGLIRGGRPEVIDYIHDCIVVGQYDIAS